jgi:hypothetical protein
VKAFNMTHNLVDLKLKNSEGLIKHHSWMPAVISSESINDHINYIITAICIFYNVNKSSLNLSVEKVDTMLQSIDSYRENFLDNFPSLFTKFIEQENDMILQCRKFKFSEGVISELVDKNYIVAKLTNIVLDDEYEQSHCIGFFIIPWSGTNNSFQKDKIIVIPFYLKESETGDHQVNTFVGSASVHNLFHDYQIEQKFICPEPDQVVNCVYKIWQDLIAVLFKLQTEENSQDIQLASDYNFYSTSVSFIEKSYYSPVSKDETNN